MAGQSYCRWYAGEFRDAMLSNKGLNFAFKTWQFDGIAKLKSTRQVHEKRNFIQMFKPSTEWWSKVLKLQGETLSW